MTAEIPTINTATLRAELPRHVRADRADPAQRPQLHRPRAAAAGRERVSPPRRRLGRRARPRDERQRAGSALERLPARRHAASTTSRTARRAAPRAPRSASTRSASSASRPTPTAPSSAATRADRSTCSPSRARTVCPAAPSSSTATTRSTRTTSSTSAASPTSTATSSAARVGGPIATDRAFFFLGYEALIERLGRTISTVVPDDNARLGILRRAAPCRSTRSWPPYLAGVPARQRRIARPGPRRATTSRSRRGSISTSCRAASTTTPTASQQFFARYTLDDADQFLPTDYPQFPREFFSRNQFFTGEYRQVLSEPHAQHRAARVQPHADRPERRVEHRPSRCRSSCPDAGSSGDIDIGGMKRFGPQISANLRLVQNVFSLSNDLTHARGRHTLKAGALVERYQDNMVNPTFSLGIYRFANLVDVPAARTPRQLHRSHAGGAVRPLLALHAVRPLRAGRRPDHAAADAERRPALRVHTRCRRTSTGATRRCRT